MNQLSFERWWDQLYWLVYAEITIPLTDFQKPYYKKYYNKGLSAKDTFKVCFVR